MSEKFKLSNSDINFTKADFIRRRIMFLSDAEMNKLDLGLIEFQWRTLDVMRDSFPEPMTQDEIMEAIKLKYERVN